MTAQRRAAQGRGAAHRPAVITPALTGSTSSKTTSRAWRMLLQSSRWPRENRKGRTRRSHRARSASVASRAGPPALPRKRTAGGREKRPVNRAFSQKRTPLSTASTHSRGSRSRFLVSCEVSSSKKNARPGSCKMQRPDWSDVWRAVGVHRRDRIGVVRSQRSAEQAAQSAPVVRWIHDPPVPVAMGARSLV